MLWPFGEFDGTLLLFCSSKNQCEDDLVPSFASLMSNYVCCYPSVWACFSVCIDFQVHEGAQRSYSHVVNIFWMFRQFSVQLLDYQSIYCKDSKTLNFCNLHIFKDLKSKHVQNCNFQKEVMEPKPQFFVPFWVGRFVSLCWMPLPSLQYTNFGFELIKPKTGNSHNILGFFQVSYQHTMQLQSHNLLQKSSQLFWELCQALFCRYRWAYWEPFIFWQGVCCLVARDRVVVSLNANRQ